jgi:acyl-CoA synthetase (AMP-forming)/AMP-acid ligase II
MPAFPPSSLHAGFAYHAEMTPDNLALIIGDRPYTYSELADTARRWAWRLIDGVRGRPAALVYSPIATKCPMPTSWHVCSLARRLFRLTGSFRSNVRGRCCCWRMSMR